MANHLKKSNAQVAELTRLFEGWRGEEPASIAVMPQAGGNRRYFRIAGKDSESYIGVYGPDTDENKAFVYFSRELEARGINVPHVYAMSADYSYYIQTDLGSNPLSSLLGSERGWRMSEMAMRGLVRLQVAGEALLGSDVVQKPFGSRQVMWDLNYFKYEFLKASGIVFDEDALEEDFVQIAKDVESIDDSMWGFMYRDCQSRNIMIKGDDVWWIDFQGARRGPCLYDAISFVGQISAAFSEEEQKRLLYIYATEYSSLTGVAASKVLEPASLLRLLRTLQVLGAYGLRGLVERRAHFLKSIKGALESLSHQVALGSFSRYPELKKAVIKICNDRRFADDSREGELTVHVFSFSYKKGYPDDFSGNGGGHMFDCRALHNPGRYEEYKELTGLDEPVEKFLESEEEVAQFLESSFRICDMSVCKYMKRGFTNLQIGYGCTGGQHRSVYCAESCANHIKRVYPEAKVVVTHREQGISHEVVI